MQKIKDKYCKMEQNKKCAKCKQNDKIAKYHVKQMKKHMHALYIILKNQKKKTIQEHVKHN